MTQFEYLFRPLKIGPVTVKNRIMNTAHSPRITGQRYLRYIEERAKGGVGLITLYCTTSLGGMPVTPARFVPSYIADPDVVFPPPLSPEGIKFFDDITIPSLRAQADIAHRHGAACFAQVLHLGLSTAMVNWQPTVAPSVTVDEYRCEVPHELEAEEIETIVQAFGQEARRAKLAGVDGVEIHGAHGYLVNQFLSPYSNKRTDNYGGSLENRMRFALEIIGAMRGHVGEGFPIGIRVNGDEFVRGGLTVKDMQEIARRLADKVAYIHISGGVNMSGLKEGVRLPYVAPWLVPLGPTVPLAAAIREVVSIPVIVTGRINDPVQAERIIAEGYADMVGMVRALFADPEFPNKAREGRLDDIRKCIGCNYGCRFRTNLPGPWHAGLPAGCTVNAAAAKEEEMELVPAPVKKRVLVAGGGPAGMEAARVLALRGHWVTLCEKENELGGHIAIVSRDPTFQDWADLARYLEHQVKKLGVDVRLGVEVTPEVLSQIKPDAVVVATGSHPYLPQVPGINGSNVVTAWQLWKGEASTGDRVLVVAGLDDYVTAPGIAEFLANQGKKVEVVSEVMTVGRGMDITPLFQLTKRLLEKGVTLTPLTGIKSIDRGSVVVFNTFTRQERLIEGVDTVVLAAGNRSNDQLYRSLKGKVNELYSIGDCVSPRRTLHAVLEGSRVGRLI